LTWDTKPQHLQESDDQFAELLLDSLKFSSTIEENGVKPDWTSSEMRRRADLVALEKGVGYHDLVSGIVLCPTEDRQYFRRIGLLEPYKRIIERLDDTYGINTVKFELELARKSQVIKPDEALGMGDIVCGAFEID
jgi:hypothetical protein